MAHYIKPVPTVFSTELVLYIPRHKSSLFDDTPIYSTRPEFRDLAKAVGKLDAEFQVPIAHTNVPIHANALVILKAVDEARQDTQSTDCDGLEYALLNTEYPTSNMKAVCGGRHELAFFLFKAFTDIGKCLHYRVRSPLMAGDDLDWGISQIQAFDRALKIAQQPLRGNWYEASRVLAMYQDEMTLNRAQEVASIALMLNEGLLKTLSGQYWTHGQGRPPWWWCDTDSPPGPAPHSKDLRIKERVGPMDWSVPNMFLPFCRPDLQQAARIRKVLQGIWDPTDLCDWNEMYYRKSCIVFEKGLSRESLVADLCGSYTGASGWTGADQSKFLPPHSTKYYFRFSHLTRPMTAETLQRWIVLIRTILELGCSDDATFKSLMQNLLAITQAASARKDVYVWRLLLCALGLEADIGYWDSKVRRDEQYWREERDWQERRRRLEIWILKLRELVRHETIREMLPRYCNKFASWESVRSPSDDILFNYKPMISTFIHTIHY